jgi:hypothetical protein
MFNKEDGGFHLVLTTFVNNMKIKKLLSILIVLITINSPTLSQGLGLSYEDVIEQREGEEYTTGFKSNVKYLKYDCGPDKFCMFTLYLFNEQHVADVVVDVYSLDFYKSGLQYLNESFKKQEESVWLDSESENLITLTVNEDLYQFGLIYTKIPKK